MEMRNEILIDAAPDRIYRYAAATEDWPKYLPHYRFVRILERTGDRRLVEMAARRNWIPVRWRAEQTNDPITPSIRFHHVAGWTRGMDVEWRFEPVSGGTRVTIDHRLDVRFPFWERIIDFFIHHIASKTLRRMKSLAEAP